MAMDSSSNCTSTDCTRVFLTHPPTLVGNAVLLALFAILIPIALALGIKYRSSGFAAAIATGLALEVAGYIGRLLLHNNPNNGTDFAVFLVGTTLGPTCICGAIFLVVPRIVAVYGEEYRTWRPAWYLLLFSALTTVSFILELAGSVVSTVQPKPTMVDTGVRVLVVGLAIQLVALTIFVFHAVLFAIALRTRQHGLDPKFAPIYNSTLFKMFLAAFTVATILVVIRTAYRIVQIAEGFQSSIAQAEILLLVLDGVAMLIAVILLLACFPARALGQSWSQTSARRLSRKPPQPIRPAPAQLPIAHLSPTYNRMSIKSSTSAHSPRKSSYPPPPPRGRGMVDSDALW
ncbi:hypothetical protein HD806DRAFT_354402 [Xylariaceae sp. AK1471]|nr:hypothetical protein HD806DRAFT_354402 [Xylariaceae sp. AK1471]